MSVAVSIVSHGHAQFVESLVPQILRSDVVKQLILTINIPEVINLPCDSRIEIVYNSKPRGFGENHNNAFKRVFQPWFVVLNPDIVLDRDPFSSFCNLAITNHASIYSPLAVNASGSFEDCWRRFPTFSSLLLKAVGFPEKKYEPVKLRLEPFCVDWVSGLCMFVSADAYRILGGFDQRYFMYYEDVDLCARAWRAGMKVLACPDVRLVHIARRASHHNFKHMRWHLFSMVRFLFSDLMSRWKT
jgi:GT2 family glycosyltransferase